MLYRLKASPYLAVKPPENILFLISFWLKKLGCVVTHCLMHVSFSLSSLWTNTRSSFDQGRRPRRPIGTQPV